jgi:hypothetical protein
MSASGNNNGPCFISVWTGLEVLLVVVVVAAVVGLSYGQTMISGYERVNKLLNICVCLPSRRMKDMIKH